AAVGNGYSISVCWTYQTPSDGYYTSTAWYPQGNNKPAKHFGFVPTSTLNPGAQNSPYEFWGGSQRNLRQTPSYSGHYDLERKIGSGSWTEITETRSLCYTDNNGGNGFAVGTVVQYRVKEKSLETDGANQSTHHSDYSGTGTVTIVTPCTPDPNTPWSTPTVTGYGGTIQHVVGDNGNWDTPAAGDITTQNNPNNLNLHFVVNGFIEYLSDSYRENTCDENNPFVKHNDPISVPNGPNDPNAPDVWVSIDNNGTFFWVEAFWQTDKYHMNGDLHIPTTSGQNYPLYFSHTNDMSGLISTWTLYVP
ncbi:MAG TPA: hypothetical protein VFO76_04025, partial [Candidatus Kapabacteria bacterium]|nr:hypothetical protein [Candidatus Kapabacteria bacterium]